ncbi:MAG: glycosyltransferase [Vicinamibacterales bacterium]
MTRQTPRVAIGLPIYNAERYLEAALDAILAQTLGDFELIVSDNASTDGTRDICEAYAARDRRIRYVRNAENLGASRNFNQAFRLGRAPYFKWAPYDDLVEPAFLERGVAVLDREPDAVLCYSRAVVIDERGRVVADYDPGPDASASRRDVRFRNLIRHPEYAIQLMGVMRTEALARTGLLGGFPSADEVLLAELALHGRFAEVPERLYRYRRHPEQSTREPEQRRRVLFFDTSLAGKVVLPKWRYLGGCLAALRRAPLGAADRWRCLAHVAGWAFVPAHARALTKDLLIAVQQWTLRRILRPSAATGSSPAA